jgi:hypothetical protein
LTSSGGDNIRQVKRACRQARQMQRSVSRDEAKKIHRDKLVGQAHCDYINLCWPFIAKSQAALAVTIQSKSSSFCLILLNRLAVKIVSS